MNNVILTKLKVQPVNDVALPSRASNILRGVAIRLGDVYVCGDAQDEIREKMFSREELNDKELIWKDNLKSVMMRSNATNIYIT